MCSTSHFDHACDTSNRTREQENPEYLGEDMHPGKLCGATVATYYRYLIAPPGVFKQQPHQHGKDYRNQYSDM